MLNRSAIAKRVLKMQRERSLSLTWAISLPLATLALAWMFTPSQAFAEEDALAFLQQRHEAVREILKDPATTEAESKARSERLEDALSGLIDYEGLSSRALRDHWATLSASDKKEFVDLLSNLVERNYQQNLESTLDFKVRYEGEEQAADGTVVHTLAQSRKSGRTPEVAIDYTLTRSGGSWKVFDITTDGVSLVTNYRSQFNRIIRQDGFDTLLHRMRKRLEAGDGML
jgi:phospholipid transport system substrate-binding protein